MACYDCIYKNSPCASIGGGYEGWPGAYCLKHKTEQRGALKDIPLEVWEYVMEEEVAEMMLPLEEDGG